MVVQPDDKIVVGGYSVVRLNPDGSADASFKPGTSPDSSVASIALRSDGKILLGGNFSLFNKVLHNGIVRLNTDGSADTTHDSGTGASRIGYIYATVVQPDGKIVIGGSFTSVVGVKRNAIARLNPDGTLDSSFDPNVNNQINSIALQADGKIVVGGNIYYVKSVARNGVARLNPDGSLDTSFNPGSGISTSLDPSGSAVASVLTQPDGKVVIGGSFTSVNGVTRRYVARLNVNGTVDTGFSPSAAIPNGARSLVLQPDGKIVVGGGVTIINGIASNGVMRLNTDGSADTGFNASNVNGNVYCLKVQPDNKIVVGGALTWVNSVQTQSVVRLNPNGSVDQDFETGVMTTPVVKSLAVQSNGKIVVGGYVSPHANPDGSFNAGNPLLTRVKSNGRTDSSFNSGVDASGSVHAVAPQPDGNVIVGGGFTSVDGADRFSVARMFGETLLPSFTSSLSYHGQLGAAFNYQLAATNSPTSFSASGLPGGLSFDPATGTISGTLAEAGAFGISLSATNSFGNGTDVLLLNVADTFANWQNSNFTSIELTNPAISGPAGDATGAGVTNLVKYALGIPPRRPGVDGLPVVSLQKAYGEIGTPLYLTLTYRHNQLATGISLAVQVTGEPGFWLSGSVGKEISRTDNGDGTETVVTHDTAPIPTGSPSRRFMRLKVTQP